MKNGEKRGDGKRKKNAFNRTNWLKVFCRGAIAHLHPPVLTATIGPSLSGRKKNFGFLKTKISFFTVLKQFLKPMKDF